MGRKRQSLTRLEPSASVPFSTYVIGSQDIELEADSHLGAGACGVVLSSAGGVGRWGRSDGWPTALHMLS